MNIFVGAPGREFLGSSEIFIMLFVTFGPINFINRFYRMAAGVGMKAQAGLALRSAVIATVAIVLSAVVGSFMLEKWQVSVTAVAFTGGIALFVAAMQSILALYGGATQAPPPADVAAQSPSTSASQLVFSSPRPTESPYSSSLLMLAPDGAKDIYITLLIVMLINLIMMLLVKPFMRVLGLPLGLLGTVVAVLQLALSIQFALFAIRTALVKGV